MMIAVTPYYAAALAVLLVVLSLRVITVRRARKVSIGDGGDAELSRRTRVQGNFAEYAPMGLILMGFAEAGGAPAITVHVLGVMLVAGRVAHAVGMSPEPSIFPLRVGGMSLTFLALLLGAGLNVYVAAS